MCNYFPVRTSIPTRHMIYLTGMLRRFPEAEMNHFDDLMQPYAFCLAETISFISRRLTVFSRLTRVSRFCVRRLQVRQTP
jgi:hypothetical protein